MLFLAILLVLAFLNSVIIYRVYRVLPLTELRRRARSGQDKNAAALYKVASYGPSLEILLWLKGSFSAILLLIWATHTSLLLALIAGLVMSYIVTAGRAGQSAPGWQTSYVSFVAPLIAKLLSWLQPVFGRPAELLKKRRLARPAIGLYEKSDLLDLLKQQNKQSVSRVPESDMRIALGALTFGDKIVGSVMTPRRAVKMVAATDTIGPHLMDELHASGFSRFPVTKDASKQASPEIIGTLFLRDLTDHPEGGKVKDVMSRDVYFINELQDLRQALSAFLKTHHHMLVVVNNFEEISGVLSIEDVMEQILGEKIVDEFDQYDDLRAVAGMDAKAEKAEHKEVAETPEKSDKSVVE